MNMKRMRGRNHRPNGGGGGGGGGGFRNQQNGIPLNRNHVFDSSGPEMRVRGTAQQLYDKYQQLARDAFSNGDRVTGEAYYQTGDFETALNTFKKMVKEYPKSNKVADATLKVGYCQYELKQWDQAEATLNQVVQKYPNTTQSSLVQGRLRALKLEGRR